MASDIVSIPKEEFDFLVKCRRLVESEFEEKYSKKLDRKSTRLNSSHSDRSRMPSSA